MNKIPSVSLTILKHLAIFFLVSTLITIIIFGIYYSKEDGFEAKQYRFLILLGAVVLNIVYFVLSLGALLNIKRSIRENLNASFLFLFALPVLLFFMVLFS
jgi:hypothetical protein